MKILITGSNGFLGRNISSELKKKHEVYQPSSAKLDFTNSNIVDNYFKDNFFDLVIHCAIIGGRRLVSDSPETTYKNLKMFFNIMRNKDSFSNLINFSSGAEFDRHTIIDDKSNNLFDSFPLDYYGMSKNIISRIIKNYPYFNLRLYGVFGSNEDDDRFIKMCINKCKSSQKLVINNDKFFDFFYVNDLIEILKQIISGKLKLNNHSLDLVYHDKLKLSQIASFVNELSGNRSELLIEGYSSNSYTGTYNSKLDNLNLTGLKEGIKEVFLKEK
ncbi:MAG: NAD-dependent epimerase/dehydratase family protein [Flavobacteriaceae bacterium]|jgi:dTDP-4-dehydrorhamnose reductase|nr:NAD-dependent epimerase/dehydratase family protein [Flavobacteriaceae bacterium]MBT6169948.1 NAD-dependent epimerase/dehydratase family protein [Flavobacteriaceae bacterium]MBT6447313.1 NAD-dependent epimerase/dehydratase family protein [Flavobacteriaceae bacterium]